MLSGPLECFAVLAKSKKSWHGVLAKSRDVHHGEERLVCMDKSLHTLRRIQPKLTTCFSEASLVLRCRKYWYVQDLTCRERKSQYSSRRSYSATASNDSAPRSEGNLLALRSFCVVATTLGNSWIAGRNFSCKSQTLGKHQQDN